MPQKPMSIGKGACIAVLLLFLSSSISVLLAVLVCQILEWTLAWQGFWLQHI